MTRPLRIEYPGAVYHVTSRGNARESIFLEDTDRQVFLEVLETVVGKYNWLDQRQLFFPDNCEKIISVFSRRNRNDH